MIINTRVVTGLGLALALSLCACDQSNDTPQVQQAASPAEPAATSTHTASPNSSLSGAKKAAHRTEDLMDQHQRDIEKAADEK